MDGSGCDGFGGYNKLKDVIRCGCLAHMRRYWYEALPGKSKKSPEKTPAEIGFDYCSQLFELEKEYSDLDADTGKPDCRACHRGVLLVTEIPWTQRREPSARAVTYATRSPIWRLPVDGRCSISNNIEKYHVYPRAEKCPVPRFSKARASVHH